MFYLCCQFLTSSYFQSQFLNLIAFLLFCSCFCSSSSSSFYSCVFSCTDSIIGFKIAPLGATKWCHPLHQATMTSSPSIHTFSCFSFLSEKNITNQTNLIYGKNTCVCNDLPTVWGPGWLHPGLTGFAVLCTYDSAVCLCRAPASLPPTWTGKSCQQQQGGGRGGGGWGIRWKWSIFIFLFWFRFKMIL